MNDLLKNIFSAERPFTTWKINGFQNAPAFLYQSLPSTHTFIKEQVRTGNIYPGSLILADSQEAGRGRHERTWFSECGKNLYFDLLIDLKNFLPKQYAQITQIIALETVLFLRRLDNFSGTNGEQITVKWPNDLLFQKSKFAGILAEVILTPSNAPVLALGMGINVNGDSATYAFLKRKTATLKEIFGKPFNREILFQVLIRQFEKAMQQFQLSGIAPWIALWRKADNFIGTHGTVIQKNALGQNESIAGRILDLQDDGSLLFQKENGQIMTIYAADLEI